MTSPAIWPVGGYAPGHYLCVCEGCKAKFTGAKRSFTCPDCVIQGLLLDKGRADQEVERMRAAMTQALEGGAA